MTDTLAVLGTAVRPVTRREFNAWIADGWFVNEQIELIEGVIVNMAAEGGPHLKVVIWLTNHFARALGEEWMVCISNPYAASEISQPLPDLAVISRATFEGLTGAVVAAQFVVEVAHSSRRRDLSIKDRLYAVAGVPTYWVVDLLTRHLVVHTDPQGERYKTVTVLGPSEIAGALGVSVDLAEVFDLLPPADCAERSRVTRGGSRG